MKGAKMEERFKEIKEEIEETISNLFGQYDMRIKGESCQKMERLLKNCMEDIEKHPHLLNTLKTQKELDFFVIQTMIYML